MFKDLADGGLSHLNDELSKAFIANPYECPVLIDHRGIVQFLSRYNSLGFSPEQAIGKHITDIIPRTRLHKVLKTSRAEIGESQEMYGDHQMII